MSQIQDGPAIAVIPVRDGRLAAGAPEVAAEVADAGAHRVLLIGSGTGAAVADLAALVDLADLAEPGDRGDRGDRVPAVELVEVSGYDPAGWADGLRVELAAAAFVVVPRSPDGRDLAPHLAAACGWPLHAGAVRVGRRGVVVVRQGGLVQHERAVGGPYVATFEPGVRGVPVPVPTATTRRSEALTRSVSMAAGGDREVAGRVATVEVLPPDPATVDLGEATRIVAAGAGVLRDADATVAATRLETLRRVGLALGASLGATRVVTDAGHLPHERQIGTTGMVVAPDIYMAFGISGAVQHTAGLGHPDHVISVNVDAHCPMMALADLAIVADATLVIDELASQLGLAPRSGATVATAASSSSTVTA